ncbi:MAG: SRPBCC family protein [Actinobacteria bacterium]|nr:SRPBCC family protein [Actinomycetota bacterium]
MTTDTQTTVTTQVYRVYIKATPEAIWDAITKPEWSERYGYGGRVEYDLRPGGAYRAYASDDMKRARAEMGGAPTPDVIVDGEVLESDPPRRLVQTWRMLMDAQTEAEGFTRLTYEIAETIPGVSKLTVTHDLAGAPLLALFVGGGMESEGAGGGWSEVLSDLKTLLETGAAFRG